MSFGNVDAYKVGPRAIRTEQLHGNPVSGHQQGILTLITMRGKNKRGRDRLGKTQKGQGEREENTCNEFDTQS